MEEKKYIQRLLEISGQYDVDVPRIPDLDKTHTPFEGVPRKHPADDNVMLLFPSSFSTKHKFYEFSLETISVVEELETITAENGSNSTRIRVWVKKGMPAIYSESFIVS